MSSQGFLAEASAASAIRKRHTEALPDGIKHQMCAIDLEPWPCVAVRGADELDELQALFELQWQRTMAAIKRWQQATGNELTWPDLGALLDWQYAQIAKLEKALAASEEGQGVVPGAHNPPFTSGPEPGKVG